MKKVVFWILVSALVMLILPWLAVSFVKGDNGMAVCFILFYLGQKVYLAHALYTRRCGLLCAYMDGLPSLRSQAGTERAVDCSGYNCSALFSRSLEYF